MGSIEDFFDFAKLFWHGRGVLVLNEFDRDPPTTHLYCSGSPDCIECPDFICTPFWKQSP